MFGSANSALMAMGFSLGMALLVSAAGQQAGKLKKEEHPEVSFATCTKSGGCTATKKPIVLDAQWRWLHDARKNHYQNCISGTPPQWDESICTSNSDCAAKCALEGVSKHDYHRAYGVKMEDGGVRLNYKTGEAVGSRVYLMDDDKHYMMFQLLNREFTFEVDSSTLECGLNGAVYFVEMKEDGGLHEGNNRAGAQYGTGYCDAQCPHDLKFISGEANFKGWHEGSISPLGDHGACCAEMDIWEANAEATAFTTHACDAVGPLQCDGVTGRNDCGDVPEDCTCCLEADCDCCGRYKGTCDKDGCDFNPYRLGDESFYGRGEAFTLDSSKPVTVITQFLTDDGTDTGKLVEIRRKYVQDGRIISNSKVSNLEGAKGADSLTDAMCEAQKNTFGDKDDFTAKGGLDGMGKALGRGMVLVMSIWDDEATNMRWLDSVSPHDHPSTHPRDKPGVERGPCGINAGNALDLRNQHSDAYVVYRNIKVGEIDSTYQASSGPDVDGPNGGTHGGHSGDSGHSGAGHTGSTECVDDDQNCIHVGCCQSGGHKCYMKDPVEAFCRASSPAGWLGHEVIGHSGPISGGGDGTSTGSGNDSSKNDDDDTIGAECCTASSGNGHPCDFCYAGAALSTGWCAQSKDKCESDCGGNWCQNGATKLYDARVIAIASPKSWVLPSALTTCIFVSLVLFSMLAAGFMWRTSRRGAESYARVSMVGTIP